MSKQDLNYGASPNDGTGDTGRGGAIKIKANFDELYQFLGGDALALPATRIPYGDGSGFHTSSANLTYDDAAVRLAVGSGGGTSTGLRLGYFGSSGLGSLWSTAVVTPGATNFALAASSTISYLNGLNEVHIQCGNSDKIALTVDAGKGPSITAGTATIDVNALSITQTWNASGVAFTALKTVITDTASAAGALAEEIFGGASGTTSLRKLTKGGAMTIPSTMTASSYIGEVYALQSTSAPFTPADAGTYYQGMSGAAPSTSAAVHVVPIPVAGTITNIRLEIAVAGTLGSSETSTVSLRLNNTTDTTITAAGAYTAARQAYSADVSITVAAGDYFQIKIAAPTWVTNPTAVVHSAVVTIRTT